MKAIVYFHVVLTIFSTGHNHIGMTVLFWFHFWSSRLTRDHVNNILEHALINQINTTQLLPISNVFPPTIRDKWTETRKQVSMTACRREGACKHIGSSCSHHSQSSYFFHISPPNFIRLQQKQLLNAQGALCLFASAAVIRMNSATACLELNLKGWSEQRRLRSVHFKAPGCHWRSSKAHFPSPCTYGSHRWRQNTQQVPPPPFPLIGGTATTPAASPLASILLKALLWGALVPGVDERIVLQPNRR